MQVAAGIVFSLAVWSKLFAVDDSIGRLSHLLAGICIQRRPASAHSIANRQQKKMKRNLMQCASSFTRCLTQIPCSSAPKVRPSRFATQRQTRCLHATRPSLLQSRPPKSRDRGPKSDEDTQTDFGALDVLRNTVAPATSIDACTSDGFALNNQMRISGSGILLVGGEAFRWWPWLREGRKEGTIAEGGLGEDDMTGKLLNARGQWEVPESAWGVLELVYPKPGMLYSRRMNVNEADCLR